MEILKEVSETSYNNLLKDSEAEVRTAAIGQIPGIIFKIIHKKKFFFFQKII